MNNCQGLGATLGSPLTLSYGAFQALGGKQTGIPRKFR